MHKSGRHFWAILCNCWQFWVIFGPLWIICSRDSRETLKYGTFGHKKFGFLAMSQRILKLCVASLLNILCFPALDPCDFPVLHNAMNQVIPRFGWQGSWSSCQYLVHYQALQVVKSPGVQVVVLSHPEDPVWAQTTFCRDPVWGVFATDQPRALRDGMEFCFIRSDLCVLILQVQQQIWLPW